MTRRSLFLLAATQMRAAPAYDPEDIKVRTARHLFALNAFARSLFGCDENTAEVTEQACKAWRESVDRKKFDSARKTAKKLFDLQEKP